jgi:histidyl-tRNA synthetase
MVEKVATPASVFIPYFDPARLADYLRLAAALRAAGIGVEVYPEPKKLGQQLKYADRRGFRVAIIAGSDEFQNGVCQVKDLASGGQQNVPLEPDPANLVTAVKQALGI